MVLVFSHPLFSLFSSTDTKAELETVQRLAREAGAADAVICNHWALGGAGAVELGQAVGKACQQPSDFKFLYSLEVLYNWDSLQVFNMRFFTLP